MMNNNNNNSKSEYKPSLVNTLAVLQWVVTFLLVGPFCILSLIYITYFTSYWYLGLFYILWMLYDWETPDIGGRKTKNTSLSLWKYFAGYFPISLKKTENLDPNKNYLFGFHPHGILVCGAFSNFAVNADKFSELFPGLHSSLLVLRGHFSFPIYRDYLLYFSSILSCARKSIDYLASNSKGNALVLAVGGAAESLNAHPEEDIRIVLKSRKGFCKIALRNGLNLVPVFSFGETEVFKQVKNPKGSILRKCQHYLTDIFGFSVPIFYGVGYGLLPFSRPITTVVGRSISIEKAVPEPSQNMIDNLHEKYMEELKKLFEENKAKYGMEKKKLILE